MSRKLFHKINEVINGVGRHVLLALMVSFFSLMVYTAPLLCVAGEIQMEERVFATVEPFYSWVLAHRFVSMPSDRERSELADFLMPELIHLMKDAEEMQGQCFKVAQEGDKPMMLEGALLVSIYEGAMEVAYEEPRTDRLAEGIVISPVILVYVDERFPKASRFRMLAQSDELELLQQEGKWLINNINFQHGRSLRSTLQDFISAGHRECVVP